MRFALALTIIVGALSLSACKQASESLTQLPQGQFATTPEYVTIKIMGYVPQAGNTFQNLFVSNYSVTAKSGQLLLNTSRDMTDTFKQSLAPTFGFTTLSPESVVTGFSDLMLYQAGVNVSQQSLLVCGSSLLTSSSNDGLFYNDDRYAGNPVTFMGLRDCDKLYLGLNPSKFNYNGNGIPDYLQMRCGLNPLNANQAFVSTAGDGVQNIDKCKRHIPIDESASTQPNQLFAYQYNNQHNIDGTTDFTISNIPILNHGAENFIAFYLTEINPSTNVASVFTAFAVLKDGYNGKTLSFSYWATAPANFFNQQIVVP
jgi:hypothetical protein